MHKQINPNADPNIVRTKLLRVSKVSLGLDTELQSESPPMIGPNSRNNSAVNPRPALRYLGSDPGRVVGHQHFGLLMRLMYRQ